MVLLESQRYHHMHDVSEETEACGFLSDFHTHLGCGSAIFASN